MLDFNHGANKPVGRAADLTERINCAIDQALVQKAGAEPRRNYLGASLIGKACLRQVQFEYQHVQIPAEDRTGRRCASSRPAMPLKT
jgi:hypothetical protein